MKQNKDPMGLDYLRLYLIGHLREHHFPQANHTKFIEQRTEEAYDTFVYARLEGRSIPVATELAMRTLLNGYYVSRYDIIYSIVEEHLWSRIPEEYWVQLTNHLLTKPQIHEVLDRYEVNGDFLSRETHQPMLNELLGVITEIFDDYGL